ncbi:hypothetical protein ACH5RR_026904 [Cinchona calisaya]|uniref:Zinc finger, CCHC-type n=1 Tax=Cinchona calisaya TaxID=153742 RepID=A0ABD2Z7U6_9GENT
MTTLTIKELSTDFTKLSRFEGGNFLRWQKNMKILLTTLHVAYVLTTERPKETEGESLEQTRMGLILNDMSDGLFDTYQDTISAKNLWERLGARYMRDDAISKKFLVTHFNNYKMVDGKPVMEQLYEIERLLNNFKHHKMNMDETIIVSSIIGKLPPSWKDFKRSLKHKKEDISLEQLGHKLCLEEKY